MFRVVVNRIDEDELHGLLDEARQDGFDCATHYICGGTMTATVTYDIHPSAESGVEEELRYRLSANMPGRVLITRVEL